MKNRLAVASKLEDLKSSLVAKLSAQYTDLDLRRIHHAVNEADALASLTGFPLLMLPDLVEEKIQAAAAWSAHQRVVRNSPSIAFAA